MPALRLQGHTQETKSSMGSAELQLHFDIEGGNRQVPRWPQLISTTPEIHTWSIDNLDLTWHLAEWRSVLSLRSRHLIACLCFGRSALCQTATRQPGTNKPRTSERNGRAHWFRVFKCWAITCLCQRGENRTLFLSIFTYFYCFLLMHLRTMLMLWGVLTFM